MAIADDFSIDVAGNITHTANTNHYTVLELHRWLQDVADDEYPAVADDVVDITSLTPSERATDQIITLINGYNIDDDASEYFYGGSITQEDGDTVYSGLIIYGAVNTDTTQIQVIQDNDYYDAASPFWGDQQSPYNGNTVLGILMRILVKSRVNGADIDQKKVRVQARKWGDTYDFFNVILGQGESVGALGTTPDGQNDIAIGTVQGWGGGDIPTNDLEGYQLIDINNGDGNQPYYSQWHYNTNALGMKATWNWIKEITGTDSPEAAEPYDMNGELFLGITHSCAYDNETGALTQNEKLVWGTDITYDNLAGGTFANDDYVVFKRAGSIINAGKIGYDDGVDEMIVAIEDIATPILEDDVIEEASSGTVTAAVTATFANEDLGGGQGVMLAENTTGDLVYFQVIQGVAPVDPLFVQGRTSGNRVQVNGTVTARTVSKVFLGAYTGTLAGAFGVGIEPDDLASADRVTDLSGTERTPPNNVTFSLSGVEVGEDRILIGNKDTGDDFKWTEMTLATALTGAAETIVDVGTGNIPDDAPATGVLRITLDDGRHRRIAYTSHDGDDEFTIGSSDWQDPDDAAIGKGVMLAFIDKLAAADPEEFTLQYAAPTRTLWLRVRDGGATPIKTWESSGILGITGGSAVAARISDA